jgi:hypothetical protein
MYFNYSIDQKRSFFAGMYNAYSSSRSRCSSSVISVTGCCCSIVRRIVAVTVCLVFVVLVFVVVLLRVAVIVPMIRSIYY